MKTKLYRLFHFLKSRKWEFPLLISVSVFLVIGSERLYGPLVASILLSALIIFSLSSSVRYFIKKIFGFLLINNEKKEHSPLLKSDYINKHLDAIDHVLMSSKTALVISDTKEKIIAVNNAFNKMSGFSQEQSIGKHLLFWQGNATSVNKKEIINLVNENDHWEGEVFRYRDDGKKCRCWVNISLIRNEKTDKPEYIVMAIIDISTLHKNEDKIIWLAYHDTLTRLANRKKLEDSIETAIKKQKRLKCEMALLFVDLDHFKEVNDTYGHRVGDQFLKEVGSRMRYSFRETDVVARIGGDEFAVFCEHFNNRSEVKLLATRLLNAFNRPFNKSDGEEIPIGASVGIAFYPEHGKNIEDWIESADKAMYQAKKKGRGTIHILDVD